MIQKPRSVAGVRIAYLLPCLIGAILLFLALLPHLFYRVGNEVYSTLSLFKLLDNTHESCMGFLNGTKEGTTTELYFHFVMYAFWLLSVISMVLYGIFVIFTTAMTVFIWTPHATPTPTANKLKRAYRIAVPNRGFFVFFQILPVLPSLFPYFLQHFSRTVLGQKMYAHYYGIPDFIIVLILSAASVTLFLTTLRAQKENQMDLFRIYKVEK